MNLNLNIFEKGGELSIAKIVLIFMVLVSSSSLFPLLSKQIKTELEGNRIAQHLLAITTLMTIIILFSNGEYSYERIIIYTAICYVVFILSTKMDLHFSLILIITLLMIFIHGETVRKMEKNILENKEIPEEEKTKMINSKKKKYLCLTGGIIGVVVIGTFIYSNKKEVQYGGGFNMLNYFLY